MKITRSAVHKLSVAADCGCQATGEYADPHLTQAIAKHFKGCQQHGNAEAIGSILMEVLDKEVADAAPKITSTITSTTRVSPPDVQVSEPPVNPLPPGAKQSRFAGPRRPPTVRAEATVHETRPTPFRRVEIGTAPKPRTAPLVLDSVPEDRRVTALLEETGLLFGGDEQDPA